VQSATLAGLNAMPIFEGKAAIVPRPEPPWLIEPEEQPVMMLPVAEVTMLETARWARATSRIAWDGSGNCRPSRSAAIVATGWCWN
jgi:hypothetical protein